MVNGFKKEAAAFARVMGYCEQFDVHSPGLTIAESVRLSAALRLAPHVCDADVRPCHHNAPLSPSSPPFQSSATQLRTYLSWENTQLWMGCIASDRLTSHGHVSCILEWSLASPVTS
jgi:hypothetical protein